MGSLHRERDAGALFDWKVKIFIVFPRMVTSRKLLG